LERRPRALEELQIPVVAVAGQADMPDFKTGAKEIADRVPHGQFELIESAGHLAPLEAPQQFKAILLRLLQSRDLVKRSTADCDG